MKHLLVFFLIIIVSACQSTPSQRINQICPSCAQFTLITSDQYELKVLYKNNPQPPIHRMHIYLEGDGIPWINNGQTPATNPTSKKLLALGLMMQDSQPSLYLNRPCYGLDKLDNLCASPLWTSARYSPKVVKQLAEALQLIKRKYQVQEFVLIGHSGGGTLAMVLAHDRQDVSGIITIGANLDHTSWTENFGYLPLDQSLNPVDLTPLAKGIFRIHLVGQQDQQVPAELTLQAAQQDAYAKVIVEEHYDHFCCWEKKWGKRLTDLLESGTNIDE